MQEQSSPSGNLQSRCYLLNLIANLNASYAVKIGEQDKLYQQINRIRTVLQDQAVREFVGEWNILWGPGLKVSKEKNKEGERLVTDNAMYLAQSSDDPTKYFIGLSGTNSISTYGWFNEDLNVNESVPWPPPYLGGDSTQTHGYIAEGTNNGLKALWEMKDPTTGQSLVNFLTAELKGISGITLYIGGHSLGGCLTPVLGAALAKAFQEQDITGVRIHAFPTAGPTPGDELFAQHVADTMDYFGIYNASDLVPLAWNFEEQAVQHLKGVYNKAKFGKGHMDTDQTIIKNLLRWAKELPGYNKYVRNPADVPQSFKVRTWANAGIGLSEDADEGIKRVASVIFWMEKSITKPLKKLNGRKDLEEKHIHNLLRFFAEMGAQHVPVYGNTQSDVDTGLFIPKTILKLVNTYFQHPNILFNSWLKKQMTKELATFLELAASSVKETDPESAVEEFIEPEEAPFSLSEAEEAAAWERFAEIGRLRFF